MIRYTLRCTAGHDFESWFASASAFDELRAAGRLTCLECGTTEVEKAPMAPAVGQTRAEPTPAPPKLSEPAGDTEAKLAALRREVEANSDYVGLSFAKEARAIHDGEAPERSIYGEARPDEAKKLIEDGVPVAPLPFVPKRKAN